MTRLAYTQCLCAFQVVCSPRAGIVPILRPLDLRYRCDGLNDNRNSVDDDALDQCLPQATNKSLASGRRLVLRLGDQVLVQSAGELLLSAANK